MNNLTKIASLPGSGAGCVSALQAEVNEQPVKVQMKSPYFDDLDWPSIVFLDEEPEC